VPEDLGFPYLGYTPPVVKNGDDYEAVFIKSEQASFAGQPKVYLKYRLVSPSGFLEEEFYMACNVAAKGKWWLYQHANEIPAAHRAGRILRWDIEALKKWMRDQQEEKPKVD